MVRHKWNKKQIVDLLNCRTTQEMQKKFPNLKLKTLLNRKSEFLNGTVASQKYKPIELDIKTLMQENSQLKSKQDFYSFVGEKILDKIIPFEPVESQFKKIPEDDQEVMVALLSDVQAGEKMSSEETGGLGEYSLDICRDRLWNWARGLVYVSKKRHNILHIDCLGDELDNIAIYKGQAHHIETGLAKQSIFFYEEFGKIISFLSDHFDEIIINKVVGNHGRFGTKGENPIMDNIEYLLFKMLEKLLSQNNKIRFNIAESWWMVVERCGWRFLLSHGDTFFGWLGISFYGAIRNKQRMDDLLTGTFKDSHFDFVEHGHFHTPAQFNGIFMNGCMTGTNEFSSRLGLGGIPMQLTLGVSKTYGVRWTHPIYLVKPNDKPKMQVYK